MISNYLFLSSSLILRSFVYIALVSLLFLIVVVVCTLLLLPTLAALTAIVIDAAAY